MNIARWVWRRSGSKSVWTRHRFGCLQREWRRLAVRGPAPAPAPAGVRVLLIPPDPVLLVASRGDEAMLSSLMVACRGLFEAPEFVIATASDSADARARALGATPCRALQSGLTLSQAAERVFALRVTHAITVGADVCDGSYDPVFSARLMMLTDLLARGHVRCLVNGFSFSDDAYPALAPVFRDMSRDVVINLRDPVSHRRFVEFAGVPAQLTADIAFLLEARALRSEKIQHLASWVEAKRRERAVVVGFNIHPLLLELHERHWMPTLVAECAAALRELIDSDEVAIVLLDHDFRDGSADWNALDPLEKLLIEGGCGGHVHRPPQPMSAAELKASMALLDGVATGRMHLAIATLGMGVPTLCFNYNGKMEGLLQHFGLDERWAVVGIRSMDRRILLARLRFFIEQLGPVRRHLAHRLPGVVEMSHRNLASFAGERGRA